MVDYQTIIFGRFGKEWVERCADGLLHAFSGQHDRLGETPWHSQALRSKSRWTVRVGGGDVLLDGGPGAQMHIHRWLRLLPQTTGRGALRLQRAQGNVWLQVVESGNVNKSQIIKKISNVAISLGALACRFGLFHLGDACWLKFTFSVLFYMEHLSKCFFYLTSLGNMDQGKQDHLLIFFALCQHKENLTWLCVTITPAVLSLFIDLPLLFGFHLFCLFFLNSNNFVNVRQSHVKKPGGNVSMLLIHFLCLCVFLHFNLQKQNSDK